MIWYVMYSAFPVGVIATNSRMGDLTLDGNYDLAFMATFSEILNGFWHFT